jgi:hypothetical protein
MSYKIVLVITPGKAQTVGLPNPSNVAGVKISNGTPFDLDISGFGTQGLLVVPAGTEYMVSAETENRGSMTVLGVDNNNVTGTGVVNLNVYLAGEKVPQGNWPVTIPTQTVQSIVSSTNTLINTTQPEGTQVIQIKASTNVSNQNNFDVFNDGSVDVWQTLGGITNLLFQIAADAVTPTISMLGSGLPGAITAFGSFVVNIGPSILNGGLTVLGGLTVSTGGASITAGGLTVNAGATDIKGDATLEGNVTISGTTKTTTIDGALNAVDNAANNYFQLSPTAGTDVSISATGKTAAVLGQLTVAQNLVTSSDVFINSGTLHFRNANTLTRLFYATGNGNGTITHNVGINPSLVIITLNTGATNAACPAWTNASTNVVNVFAPAVNWSAMCVWS